MSYVKTKSPGAVVDWDIDWTDELNGDTIASSSFTVSSGITLDSDTNTATSAKAWLSGGVHLAFESAVNTIITAGGRTLHKTIYYRIIQK